MCPGYEGARFFVEWLNFRPTLLVAVKRIFALKKGNDFMKFNTRKLVTTAMLGAIATVLMFFSFSVPFMPSFIKLDISELPALIASFATGPLSGVCVCLIKNLVNVTQSTTGGVGEFSNFLLGVCFVLPAGLIYKYHKNRRGAIIGSIAGAVMMGICSVPINYFITYPMYMNFLPLEHIIKAYQAIFPGVDGLLGCLVTFNLPYTIMKGILCAVITFIIYKHISVLIKGK